MIESLLSQALILTGGLLYCSNGIAGGYIGGNTITICDVQMEQTQIDYVIAHELGHYVGFIKLTEDQKKTYTKLYERDKNYPKRSWREYSRQSAIEDFADSFALAYIKDPKLFTRSKDRYLRSRIEAVKKLTKNIK